MANGRTTAAHGRRSNLLSPLGAFVGRATLVDAIGEIFSHGGRLVTLLGPGGMGKTRLATRYAELRGHSYLTNGGVWFCDLTEARDVADVCSTVARTLGLRLSAQLDASAMSEHVGQALVDAGSLLVILDNFEQLAPDAARTVEQWCAVAPEARVLVTSRVRLAVAGEVVLELEPLTLPARGESDAARLMESEAVILLRERARAAGGWAETAGIPSADVAALVRALDGIPLALELAAASMRILSPGELLSRLAVRRDLLSVGVQTSGRHATLRTAIDGSWSLLDDLERSVLAQCAVFAGDFSLDAAEHVIAVAGREHGARSVVDVLAALRDKSLVRSGQHRDAGHTRFSLYLSIREYAAEHLGRSEDAPAVVERHRRYYVDLTRAWAETFARTGEARSRALLGSEKEQLLAISRALRAAPVLCREEASDLGRVVLHLAPILEAESSSDELSSLLTAGIDAARHAGDLATLGRLLVARGNAFGIRGLAAPCLEALEAARDLGRTTGDRVLEAEALVMSGVRYRQQGHFEEARIAAEEAGRMLDGAGYPRTEGANLAVMGLLLCDLGEAAESRRYNLRARAMFDDADDRWSEALAIANLAQLDQAAGDFEQAAYGYNSALERFRAHGDGRYEGRYLGYRASRDHEAGASSAARAGYASSIELLARFGMRHHEGLFHACLGALEAHEGHAREALDALERAENLLGAMEAPAFRSALSVHRGQLDLLLAREAEARGDGERAARLLSSARQRLADPGLMRSSEDVRFAKRLLERALAGHLPGRRAPAATPASLVVGPDARWFRSGEGTPVDLGRRGALRLILVALVERRLTCAGDASTWEVLLAAGWPGERVLAEAGATRVRVAVSTLRRLGLAGILLTREDGYLLDPRASVRADDEL